MQIFVDQGLLRSHLGGAFSKGAKKKSCSLYDGGQCEGRAYSRLAN